MTATWELVPKKGIRHGQIELFLGMKRADAWAALADGYALEHRNSPNEDDFESKDGQTWIRLRYHGDKLQDVEFLRGDLQFSGLALHAHASWTALAPALEKLGYKFHGAEQLGGGHECTELGVNIATHEDVGGDGDEIEWVIVASSLL
jgi:hypothetical protein